MKWNEALKIAQNTNRSKIDYRNIGHIFMGKIRPYPFYNGYKLFSNVGEKHFEKYRNDIENGKYIVGIATYWGCDKPEFIDDSIGLYEV